MMKIIRMRWSVLHIAAALTVLMIAPLHNAAASSLKTIYSFCSKSGCPLGVNPFGDLIMDRSTTIYGTTLNWRLLWCRTRPGQPGQRNFSIILLKDWLYRR